MQTHAEVVAHAEFPDDPKILLQRLVIEQLNLDDDLETSAMKYHEEGYSKKCREIMETDTEVQNLLASEKLDDAAILITTLLQHWKRTLAQKRAA